MKVVYFRVCVCVRRNCVDMSNFMGFFLRVYGGGDGGSGWTYSWDAHTAVRHPGHFLITVVMDKIHRCMDFGT